MNVSLVEDRRANNDQSISYTPPDVSVLWVLVILSASPRNAHKKVKQAKKNLTTVRFELTPLSRTGIVGITPEDYIQ